MIFDNESDAQRTADLHNGLDRDSLPLVTTHCRWCLGWHLYRLKGAPGRDLREHWRTELRDFPGPMTVSIGELVDWAA